MFSPVKLVLFACAVILVQVNAGQVRVCLSNPKAVEKCKAIDEFLQTKKAGVQFDCSTSKDCVSAVAVGEADATIVNADEHPAAVEQLDAVLFESYEDSNLIVALVDADKESKLDELPLYYEDKDDLRLLHAALYINHHRNDGKCAKTIRTSDGDSIKLERYHEVKDQKNKKLVCIENNKMVTKSISEYKNCHVESNIPNAVMIKKAAANKDEIVNAFKVTAEKTGHGSEVALFGPFHNQKDLIFSDEAIALVPTHSEPNGITVEKFFGLHCNDIENHGHAHDHPHDHDHDHDNAHNHPHHH